MSKKTESEIFVNPKSLSLSELIKLLGTKIHGNETAEDILTDGKLDVTKLIAAEMAADPEMSVEVELGTLADVFATLAQGWHVGKKGVLLKRIEIRFPESDEDEEEHMPSGLTAGHIELGNTVKTTFISDDSDDKNAVEIKTNTNTETPKKKKSRTKNVAAACSVVGVSVRSVRRKKKKHGGKH